MRNLTQRAKKANPLRRKPLAPKRLRQCLVMELYDMPLLGFGQPSGPDEDELAELRITQEVALMLGAVNEQWAPWALCGMTPCVGERFYVFSNDWDAHWERGVQVTLFSG